MPNELDIKPEAYIESLCELPGDVPLADRLSFPAEAYRRFAAYERCIIELLRKASWREDAPVLHQLWSIGAERAIYAETFKAQAEGIEQMNREQSKDEA